jgi:hypothetical protein
MRPPRAVPEAVDHFVARVLRRAHETAEADGSPSEARAIRGVAHLFADELSASYPDFDRVGFVAAATEGRPMTPAHVAPSRPCVRGFRDAIRSVSTGVRRGAAGVLMADRRIANNSGKET